MNAETPQSFENHAKIVPGFHYGVFGVLAINLLWSLVRLVRTPSPESGLSLALALALVGLFFYARIFSLTVQDRVIRLEMRLRLRELLPEDLRGHIQDLERRQLIALRFASDAELPDLVRKVLAGELKGGMAIKKSIRNWQADRLRC